MAESDPRETQQSPPMGEREVREETPDYGDLVRAGSVTTISPSVQATIFRTLQTLVSPSQAELQDDESQRPAREQNETLDAFLLYRQAYLEAAAADSFAVTPTSPEIPHSLQSSSGHEETDHERRASTQPSDHHEETEHERKARQAFQEQCKILKKTRDEHRRLERERSEFREERRRHENWAKAQRKICIEQQEAHRREMKKEKHELEKAHVELTHERALLDNERSEASINRDLAVELRELYAERALFRIDMQNQECKTLEMRREFEKRSQAFQQERQAWKQEQIKSRQALTKEWEHGRRLLREIRRELDEEFEDKGEELDESRQKLEENFQALYRQQRSHRDQRTQLEKQVAAFLEDKRAWHQEQIQQDCACRVMAADMDSERENLERDRKRLDEDRRQLDLALARLEVNSPSSDSTPRRTG